MTAPVLDHGDAGVAATTVDPVQEWLRQATDGDPRLQLLAQLLQSRPAGESRPPEPAPSSLERLERRLARLQRLHLQLREHYLRLADALGACPRCWGEDARCHACGGRGMSGFFEPDEGLFVQYVLPVVRRMRVPSGGTLAPGARNTARVVRAGEAESQPEV